MLPDSPKPPIGRRGKLVLLGAPPVGDEGQRGWGLLGLGVRGEVEVEPAAEVELVVVDHLLDVVAVEAALQRLEVEVEIVHRRGA